MTIKGNHIGRKFRPPSEEKVTIGISWSDALDKQVRATAAKRNISISALVREYVEAGLAKEEAANDYLKEAKP